MNIDDDLLRSARTRAVNEGRRLGELITEALRERLMRRPGLEREPYLAVTAGEDGLREPSTSPTTRQCETSWTRVIL